MLEKMKRLVQKWFELKAKNENPLAITSAQTVLNLPAESSSDINTLATESLGSQLVAYDENLLERSRTQWQFGDWESLAAIDRDTLQHHPDRAKLVLLVAAGHQQLGNHDLARQFTRLAQDWGCSKNLISQVLIAGVHNTLGCASIITGDQPRAHQHFQDAIQTGSPRSDIKLVSQGRIQFQTNKVNLNAYLQKSSLISQKAEENTAGHLNEKKKDETAIDGTTTAILESEIHEEIEKPALVPPSGEKKQLYDEAFYAAQIPGSELSARIVLNELFAFYKPKTLIDIGCGAGTWVKVANELGVEKTLGIDGEYAIQNLLIPRDNFLPKNLNQPLEQLGHFDLAMSLEVAEHLEVDRAQGFIDDICKTSKVVLFSAAIPHQGGTGHINENWPEYWAEKFKKNGYFPIDCLREQLWTNEKVEWWYSQNVLLFVHQKEIETTFRNFSVANPMTLTRIHPKLFVKRATRT
jgi:2-polyprenyl-3-methyl-5-hydroxy-6-metoxy-1,4-benzoquinol methylase